MGFNILKKKSLVNLAPPMGRESKAPVAALGEASGKEEDLAGLLLEGQSQEVMDCLLCGHAASVRKSVCELPQAQLPVLGAGERLHHLLHRISQLLCQCHTCRNATGIILNQYYLLCFAHIAGNVLDGSECIGHDLSSNQYSGMIQDTELLRFKPGCPCSLSRACRMYLLCTLVS